jgi:hypothetical protein
MMRAFYYANTNRVVIKGARDPDTGVFINAGIGPNTVDIYDKRTEVLVANATNLPLTPLGANGEWRATVPANADVDLKQILEIRAIIQVDGVTRLEKRIEARVVPNDS